MDNLKKIEQLVNKAGCSYEDAKTALEGCSWDMIDAIIMLEREGKVQKTSVEHTAQKADEPVEIIPEVTVEKASESASQQVIYVYDDNRSGNHGNAGKTGGTEGTSKEKRGLWNRIKRIMMNNRMLIIKSNGQQIVDLPILVPVIALITFFWATIILAVVAIIFGCRFHFEGEDLGKININSTMDKATDYAEKVKKDIAGKANGRQNTDN